MMTFSTDRPNQVKYVFIVFFISLGVTTIPILVDITFKTRLVGEGYYFIATPGLLLSFIINIYTDRLHQITFDTERKQIIFLYKNILSKENQMTLFFENSRVEISHNNSKWSLIFEPLTIYFLKNKKEVFEINKSKDGFSVNTLNQICRTIEKVSLPISNV